LFIHALLLPVDESIHIKMQFVGVPVLVPWIEIHPDDRLTGELKFALK
jgi:hypothetical protein